MPQDIRTIRTDCPRDLADICVKMMQKRPEKRFANMREVADALEAWLLNHGYKYEPGSGEAAAKAAVLTAGGPAVRRSGGGSFGASHGSFSGSGQRITGSSSGTIRPKVPIRNDDTVYDKNRVDTRKGDSGLGKSGSGSTKKPGSKSLPVAKALDSPSSDKKSLSGPMPVVTGSSVAKSGPQPVAKPATKSASGPIPVAKPETSAASSGPRPAVTVSPAPSHAARPAAKKPPTMSPWLIAGAVLATVLLAGIVIAIAMAL
jgi:hypothetical protein